MPEQLDLRGVLAQQHRGERFVDQLGHGSRRLECFAESDEPDVGMNPQPQQQWACRIQHGFDGRYLCHDHPSRTSGFTRDSLGQRPW